MKGTPIKSPRSLPMAMVKIRRKRPALIKGAMIVWLQTLRKRITSRRASV